MEEYIYTNKGGQIINQDSLDARSYKDISVFILADGLGGHKGGEIASQTVVQELLNESDKISDIKLLSDHFAHANDILIEKQIEMELASMKTTAVYLGILGNKALPKAIWGHVGDSRLYHLSNNQIAMITKDHSVSYKKYLSGEITYAQINFDDDRSSLLSVCGSKERFNPEFYETEVRHGDAFLLCSDGFWEYIYNEEILIDYLKSDTPKEWAELMLLRHIARVRPNNDNFSLITVFI